MNIARFDKRIFAWLLDEVLPLGFGAGMAYILLHFVGTEISIFLIVFLSILADYFGYALLNGGLMHLSNGYTLGMAIFGIKTVHPDGERMRFHECWLKALLTGVIVMDIINAVYMVSIHTERSVFDRLTNSLVIDKHNAVE
jgi:uncharacterized RDD family membrane protein YckC